MKKYIIAVAALAALVSCRNLKEEWDPVFTLKQPDAAWFVPASEEFLRETEGLETITPIADLKALYNNKALLITDNIWIKGKVISSDQSGNIYNEVYIQDGKSEKDGSAITVKLGKSSLYNEYELGRWVYVKCKGLTLGSYNGMIQLGMGPDETVSNEYETSYLNMQAVIDAHVFRGFLEEPFKPLTLTEDELKKAITAGGSDHVWGKVVKLSGLVYADQVFALLYPNPNMAHKSTNPENRVFLQQTEGTWGVTTWSCTKAAYIQYLQSGAWDAAKVGSGSTIYGPISGSPFDYLDAVTAAKFGPDADLPYKDIMIKYATANYMSHYFKMGSLDIQIRTSGYAKFADQEIDPAIREDKKPFSIEGIVTLYNGAAQLSLVNDPSESVIIE